MATLIKKTSGIIAVFASALLGGLSSPPVRADISQEPLFLTQAQAPMVMLNMARDHRLYYEAYNDYSDLNSDGSLDIGYKPTQINYYGYFDSFKCYQYSATDRRFNPVSLAPTKTCGGVYWSGDFLNYVTTSRMDALRRVFFGGYRSTDTVAETILQRVYIPMDSHTWGKEYRSIAHDGYDIADYTPLTVPAGGRRHLFANVTLTQNAETTGDTANATTGGHGVYTTLDVDAGDEATNPPLMRVLENSSLRIWNWISKERPVAGANCLFGTATRNCVTGDVAGTGGWQVVPSSSFTGLNATYYDIDAGTTHANNATEMAALFTAGTTVNRGTLPITRIDCNSTESYTVRDDVNNVDVTYTSDCNPLSTTDNYFATMIQGSITVPTAGTYQFAVDGNNAVDLAINGTMVIGRYGVNVFTDCDDVNDSDYGAFDTTCSANVGSIALTAGTHTIRFRHQEVVGSEGYRLWVKVGAVAVRRSNYEVRVKVCDSTIGQETNCKSYTDGSTTTYKPTGLLHSYGANDGMYFGLLTGSYRNNTQGGVLRKNISSFSDEYVSTTGIFNSATNGIISTINKLRTTGFRYSDRSYQGAAPSGTCGWITTRAMNNTECEMWGNPLAEMVYESLRYISGKTAPTAAFDYSGATHDANTLVLPKPAWIDPYSTSGSRSPASIPYCSKPYIMAISDSYPSFDSDGVPGNPFSAVAGDLANVATQPNVATQGQTMWDNETGLGGTKSVFIGQSGATFDSAPSAKDVTSFGNIRGLAPSDPTRQGSYYSAALAYYARINDLRSDQAGTQKLGFYSVALAPPLPTIEVPVPGGSKITIVPFAKSVGGSSINPAVGNFQPTNQIVDFYVDTIRNTDAGNTDAAINGGRPYYRFRINYEDVEQGADHDMDAIAVYDIWLNSDNTVTVNIVSEYAAGGIMQHMGYIISGTSADGTYLVVRDVDTAANVDPDYFLDTPRQVNRAADGSGNRPLPLTYPVAVTIGTACANRTDNYACRTFTAASSSSSAILLRDPMWYAAKWGGFNDDSVSPDSLPQTNEWDVDGDGVPDNYFLVVNPLELERQMSAALAKIAKDSGTAAALATNSTSLRTSLKLFQARFSSDGWGGELNAYNAYDPTLPLVWQAQCVMAGYTICGTSAFDGALKLNPATRVVLTYDPDAAAGSRGIPFQWASMTTAGTLQASLDKAWNNSGGTTDSQGSDRVLYLRGSDAIPWARTRPCITGTTGSTCITNYLGDIINSASQFVGVPAFGYSPTSYKAFYDSRATRTQMLYVGGNDGMLHGFDANTGIERLAYVPSSLYKGALLSKLTGVGYGDSDAHAYYVDGTPTVGDVCRMTTTTNDNTCEKNTAVGNGDNWKTLLVGGLGGGGQGIYALDITRPEDFSEANAASLVKWEFTDADDADLGRTYSRPAIVRVCTARDSSSTDDLKPCTAWRWTVVFGNGFENAALDDHVSASSYAHVFILDAITGAVLAKMSTNIAATPNGMNTLAPVDLDADGVVDAIYGADLAGNMWKFDVAELSSAALDYRLYQSATTAGAVQAITTAPEVTVHPLGGVMVIFGTGKYLEVTDKNTTQTQDLYGIWDKPGGSGVAMSLTRANLQQQSLISDSRTESGVVFSTSTANDVDWTTKLGWYMDLTANGTAPSERVAYDPQIIANVLNVVTVVPSSDVCAYGGDSWDFLLDPLTGSRTDYAAFSGVPQITLAAGGQAYASRRKSTVGISPAGTVITVTKGEGLVLKGGSTGDVEKFGVNLIFGLGRRLSWREMESD
jgi:type IV pilus assembly protein PilY1